MKKLAAAAGALCIGALAACSSTPTASDQLVGYLTSVAPPQVEILSAKCDEQTGVCMAKALTSFHSPEPAAAGYWCRVSTAGEFVAECPGVRWLEGSQGTPIADGLASLLLPSEGTPVQEPCAGLSNTDLLFCLYAPASR